MQDSSATAGDGVAMSTTAKAVVVRDMAGVAPFRLCGVSPEIASMVDNSMLTNEYLVVVG